MQIGSFKFKKYFIESCGVTDSLYALSAEVAALCHSQNVPFAIENSYSSDMWRVPCMLVLSERQGVVSFSLHACMFGDDRNRRVKVLTNMLEL